MIFVTESGKEIQVPSDYSFQSLEKFTKEIYQQGYADAITEFDRICEETRSHNFGACDADFVIDVIKAKVKEQLKEQKNE